MAIFSNFFVNINTHIIRCNAGEKIKSFFELFTKQKVGFRFVLFLSVQTLHNTRDAPEYQAIQKKEVYLFLFCAIGDI